MTAIEPKSLFPDEQITASNELVTSYSAMLPDAEAARQDAELTTGKPHLLRQIELAGHIDQVIASDAFQEAVQSLKLHQIEGIDVMPHFQAGAEGLISLFRIRTPYNSYILTSHVSRESVDRPEGQRLSCECEDLSYLSTQFRTRLLPHLRRIYTVVSPLSYSEDFTINGKTYPIMMMPFEGKGELRVDGISSNLALGVSTDFFSRDPLFRYAVGYTPEMKQFNEQATLSQSKRDARTYSNALLRFNAFIYHVTGGRMLADLRLNAGDILVDLMGRDSSYTLSSIHNGFTEPVGQEEWFGQMANHIEEYAELRMKPSQEPVPVHVYPFPQSRNMMRTIFKAAGQSVLRI